MNTLLHRPLAILLLPLLLGASLFAQRPQGSDTTFTDILGVGSSLVALRNDGSIHHSTNGGVSYTQIHSVSAPDTFFALAANANTVIAAGTDGILHRAADIATAPSTWTPIAHGLSVPGDLRGIAARNTGVWIAAGDAILRSADNGLTWTKPSSTSDLQAVTHVGGNIWVAVGGVFGAEIHRSIDNGLTWSAVTAPVAPALLAVAADGFGNVLAVGADGGALFSDDQGATFTVVGAVDVSEALNAVVSTGENTWIIGGQQRTLLSLDEGVASPLLEPLEDPTNTEGLALLNGAVVLAGVAVVPAPVISSPVTVSAEPIQVTLTADPGVDSTHYTLNGSDPTTASTTYATPFWVTDDLSVKAVSVKEGVYSIIVIQAFQAELIEYELSIALSGADLLITLSDSLDGQPYQLQYSSNLAAVPQVWTNEGDPKPGSGTALLWTLSPIPGGTRAWRAVLP
jgi:photosystem II stability/assembly factor-like uncharacterized protein